VSTFRTARGRVVRRGWRWVEDIITGNCYWAHGPAVAPGAGEEGVLYWFKLVRNADKSVDWVPHLID
jgi:hypothetical protein